MSLTLVFLSVPSYSGIGLSHPGYDDFDITQLKVGTRVISGIRMNSERPKKQDLFKGKPWKAKVDEAMQGKKKHKALSSEQTIFTGPYEYEISAIEKIDAEVGKVPEFDRGVLQYGFWTQFWRLSLTDPRSKGPQKKVAFKVWCQASVYKGDEYAICPKFLRLKKKK